MYELLMMLPLVKSIQYTAFRLLPQRSMQTSIMFQPNDVVDWSSPPNVPVKPSSYYSDKNPLCKDCVYFVGDKSTGKCVLYPIIASVKPPTTDGVFNLSFDYLSCIDARKGSDKCGETGKYYSDQ